MYKVTLGETALKSLNSYAIKLREDFQFVFKDSLIWDDEKIISMYSSELEERYNSIINIIFEKAGDDRVIFEKNGAIIRWRTKILLVYFFDEGDTRIITDIDIR